MVGGYSQADWGDALNLNCFEGCLEIGLAQKILNKCWWSAVQKVPWTIFSNIETFQERSQIWQQCHNKKTFLSHLCLDPPNFMSKIPKMSIFPAQ